MSRGKMFSRRIGRHIFWQVFKSRKLRWMFGRFRRSSPANIFSVTTTTVNVSSRPYEIDRKPSFGPGTDGDSKNLKTGLSCTSCFYLARSTHLFVLKFYPANKVFAQVRAGSTPNRMPPPLWNLFEVAYVPLRQTESTLLKMTNIYTMLNQIVFFTLCDRAVGCSQNINSFYSLMLYNVLAYCLNYVRDAVQKEDWSPYVNVSEHSNVRHLAMTTTRLVLEWTKAVTVITTIVFLVLAFSAKDGLENYRPSLPYTAFTLAHYVATEKTFLELSPKLLSRLQLEAFDSLESLWAPAILKGYTILTSALFSLAQILYENYRLAVFGLYVNVVLGWKDADRSCFRKLKKELRILGQFRDATINQISSFDDICSVCLSPMKTAKVTPCQHLFHKDCLRRCLENRTECPICNRELCNYACE